MTGDAPSCTIWTAKLWPVFPSSDATGTGIGGTSVAPLDPVTADRAALWLQWLRSIPAAGYHGLSYDAASALRRTHTSPSVLAAWRNAPRISLRDLLGQADAGSEFAWRRTLRGAIDVRLLLGAASQGGNVGVSALVKRLGRAAIPVASIAEGVGTAVSDVASASSRGSDTDLHAALALSALRGLDNIAATARPDVAGRALALQSALLWAMAGWGSHGYRSGPAHNVAWLPIFALLEVDYAAASLPAGASPAVSAADALSRRAFAVRKLAELRDGWCSRPHLIGRAARHYERAAQLLTAQCIATAPITAHAVRPLPPLKEGAPASGWVVATCPIRVDLAGGWTDTPPITFEAAPSRGAAAGAGGEGALEVISQAAQRGGGLVVNVAVTIAGARPLGARTRLTREGGTTGVPARIVIRTRGSAEVERESKTAAEVIEAAVSAGGPFAAPGEVLGTTVISSLTDLSDYNQPHAEGALVKCAMLAMGLVRLPRPAEDGGEEVSAPSLSEQLTALLGGGLEVETWSLVPQGSGLGTSSILAAATLASLCRAAGREYDHDSLNHMVLKTEQMLSTGGGWQDQVGGLWPGVKASSCAAALPVVVRVHPLAASAHLSSFLSSRLFLLYTGKTRLAKNLLQRVLRQWAVREGPILGTVEGLRANAVDMTRALLAEDPAAVGACLSTYWDQKKCMAPQAEPEEVTAMLAAMRDHVHGASLCGAGGGGFLAGVLRTPGEEGFKAVEAALRADPVTSALKWTLHRTTVDDVGMLLQVEL